MSTNNPRRNFLGRAGALTAGAIFPFSKKIKALANPDPVPLACTVLPTETRGPFPLFNASQIASQTALIRSDIRESQTGVPLNLTITVQNQNCIPIAGAQVYIWHCSKDGLYSGYSNGMNPGQAGLTYLRGIQVSDSAGQVNFTTVFPGWYNGRLTHIHVEAYVGNILILTSQFAFPLDSVAGSSTALVNASYGNSNNTITSYSGDNIFNNGYTDQLLTPTGSVGAGYTASHVFTMNYTVVPLNIISFTAGVENKNPMLWWITEHETNVARFEVEQSTHPSKNYQHIGSLSAANKTTVNNYSFSLQPPLPAEITYFRLKVVNADGTYRYSAVVTLHSHSTETVSVVNTFVTSQLVIKHPAVYANSALKIISLNGQLMATGKLKTGVSLTSIDVKYLNTGVYLLIIETGIDRFVTKFYKGS
jgi:protocatechuate 3,4-dioxygenase beta subunit